MNLTSQPAVKMYNQARVTGRQNEKKKKMKKDERETFMQITWGWEALETWWIRNRWGLLSNDCSLVFGLVAKHFSASEAARASDGKMFGPLPFGCLSISQADFYQTPQVNCSNVCTLWPPIRSVRVILHNEAWGEGVRILAPQPNGTPSAPPEEHLPFLIQITNTCCPVGGGRTSKIHMHPLSCSLRFTGESNPEAGRLWPITERTHCNKTLYRESE